MDVNTKARGRRFRRGAVVVSTVALLTFAGTASAATTVEQATVLGPVTLVGDADGTMTTISDASPVRFTGDDLALGAGSTCTQRSGAGVTPVEIVCSTTAVTADLGDGDDHLTLGLPTGWYPTRTVVYAGGGNDTIYGSGRSDNLNGEAGDDVLHGGPPGIYQDGPTDDVLDGGPGDDYLDGGPGQDDFIGGDGDDLITSELPVGVTTDQDGDVDCGAGTDLALNPLTRSRVGCEKSLPAFVSRTGAQLRSDPVAGGARPTVEDLVLPATTAPADYSTVEWYLCTAAVVPLTADGQPDPACRPLTGGTQATDAGRFLGAVITPGVRVGLRSILSEDGWTTAVARRLLPRPSSSPRPPRPPRPAPAPTGPCLRRVPYPSCSRLATPTAPPAVRCTVPKLKRLTRRQAVLALHAAHCRVGRVTVPKRKRKGKTLRVVSQWSTPGASRPADTRVSFRLGS